MNAVNHHVVAEHTIQAWCMAMSSSIKERDLDTHMQLVSPHVQVYGIPGNGVINYKGWEARRKFEFENGELLLLNYQGIRLITFTPRRATFNTTETMIGKNGKMVLINKNIVLEKEQDGQWRVVEEKVKGWQVRKINLGKY